MSNQSGRVGLIEICTANKRFFALNGKPTVLIGGSKEDNLFQVADLEEHLDLLRSVGGNYVRCTMSGRDEGDVWPFVRDDAGGPYDLDAWNEVYFNRLDTFLRETRKREIVVQIEIWATYDFYTAWSDNPWNPRNNCTYTEESSGLKEEWPFKAWTKINPFFETVPAIADNKPLLARQERFVDKLLAISFNYDHVLYCMDNETNADPAWSFYWNSFVRSRAKEQGKKILTTEMWDNWDPSVGELGELDSHIYQQPSDHPYLGRANVKVTLAHPEAFDFIEISNHNGQRGSNHWRTLEWVRNKNLASDTQRPLTCVKIYGGDAALGSRQDGIERFWRNLLGGAATARFHRPPGGIGLDELAQKHLRAARAVLDRFPLWDAHPEQEAIVESPDNGAYCSRLADGTSLVCIFCAQPITIDCSGLQKSPVHWFGFDKAAWVKNASSVERNGDRLTLNAPEPRPAVTIIG